MRMKCFWQVRSRRKDLHDDKLQDQYYLGYRCYPGRRGSSCEDVERDWQPLYHA